MDRRGRAAAQIDAPGGSDGGSRELKALSPNGASYLSSPAPSASAGGFFCAGASMAKQKAPALSPASCWREECEAKPELVSRRVTETALIERVACPVCGPSRRISATPRPAA